MKTSLCLIGKNEAKGLRGLIKDIGKYFHEIILISTAHDTKLVRTAQKLGVKVYECQDCGCGADFDFSKARNYSFEKATGNILAWFDLDDRIPNGYVIPFIFNAFRESKADWVYCNYNYSFDEFGNVNTQHLKPRFMRAGTGKWAKSVHETFEPNKNVTQVKDSDFLIEPLIINHDNIINLEKSREKLKRNLPILMKELEQDGEKTDLRTIQYIGITLMGLGRYQEAIPFFLKHYKESGSKDDQYWSLQKVAFCYRELKDYEKAANLLLESLKLFPQWSTAYYSLAEIYSLQADYKNVIEWTLIGSKKKYPDTLQMTQPLEHSLYPMARLSEAYLMTGEYKKAHEISKVLHKKFKGNRLIKELARLVNKVVRTERFVKSFIDVATTVRQEDRLKAIKLFEILPNNLDGDIRIQNLRFAITPPKTWGEKSVVIYCGQGIGEQWAYPSIFTGIGGSETAVIWMSKLLAKKGYKITVYNNCGESRGEYDGVNYLPFYHFNPMDNFNTLIAWRNPSFFGLGKVNAKKKIVWLHDIAYSQQFSDKAIKNTDKFIFLSKWHRDNMLDIPDSKIFLSNNGIDPELFKDEKEKRPNSLLWTASYDRGLLPFIKNIWPLIKKEIPDVTIDVAYGWSNIDREKDKIPELARLREELTPLLEQEGITHHGRIGQQELAELYKTSQVYAYASEFGETNNISSQQAQAGGCFVITTPQAGATPERLIFGQLVDGKGIYTDNKQQKKYAEKVVKYLKKPIEYGGFSLSEKDRQLLINNFSWQNTADSWQKDLL